MIAMYPQRLLLWLLCCLPMSSVACELSVIDRADQQVAKVVILSKTAIEKWQEAQVLGYEWLSIQPLLEAACVALQQGDLSQASVGYRRARQQAMLAIEQAYRERTHWQKLVPYREH